MNQKNSSKKIKNQSREIKNPAREIKNPAKEMKRGSGGYKPITGKEKPSGGYKSIGEAKQKPYVSSDSDGKHVMDASGKIVKTFKDMAAANAYIATTQAQNGKLVIGLAENGKIILDLYTILQYIYIWKMV